MHQRHHENIDLVPSAEPNINDEERIVYIGFRPIGADFLKLTTYNPLKLFKSSMPDPNYHWSIIVGKFYHHLQSTSLGILEDGWNYYGNAMCNNPKEWTLFEVGKTRYNDAAIASAGKRTIEAMDEKYNLYKNNCQSFALKLGDMICWDGRRKVKTSYFSNDLHAGFVPGLEQGAKDNDSEEAWEAFVEDGSAQADLMMKMREIMNENTPKVTVNDLVTVEAGNPEKSESK